MLWVGLGNPGRSYAGNRHNVGFMALDRIVRDYSFSNWKVNTSSAVSEGRIGPVKVRVLKPLSFMNRSGLPVANVASYYNLHPDQITVFHDEIDLREFALRRPRRHAPRSPRGLEYARGVRTDRTACTRRRAPTHLGD